jgi:hypothetical protein
MHMGHVACGCPDLSLKFNPSGLDAREATTAMMVRIPGALTEESKDQNHRWTQMDADS